jgi:hypothetical protein
MDIRRSRWTTSLTTSLRFQHSEDSRSQFKGAVGHCAIVLVVSDLVLAQNGARQPADLDSADRLRASMDVRRSGTNADDRLPLASLGRV